MRSCILAFAYDMPNLELISRALFRPNLQVPGATHLGIHNRPPDPQRFSTMAGLRATDAPVALVMDRERKRWRDTAHSRVLGVEGAHVYHQLRLGGLGDP